MDQFTLLSLSEYFLVEMNGILLALLFNSVFAADENCVKNGFSTNSPYYNKSPYFEACLRGKDEFLCRNKYEDQGSTDDLVWGPIGPNLTEISKFLMVLVRS